MAQVAQHTRLHALNFVGAVLVHQFWLDSRSANWQELDLASTEDVCALGLSLDGAEWQFFCNPLRMEGWKGNAPFLPSLHEFLSLCSRLLLTSNHCVMSHWSHRCHLPLSPTFFKVCGRRQKNSEKILILPKIPAPNLAQGTQRPSCQTD